MKLSLKPIDVTKGVWYYEEREGLGFVVQHRIPNPAFMGGVEIKSDQFTVSWRKIRASLRRKDAK
jgi:hypothetical protein